MPHINHDLAPNISARDNLLIAGVRFCAHAWGDSAAYWLAREIGLSDALTDIAMDRDERLAYEIVRNDGDECRILVWRMPGMPPSTGDKP